MPIGGTAQARGFRGISRLTALTLAQTFSWTLMLAACSSHSSSGNAAGGGAHTPAAGTSGGIAPVSGGTPGGSPAAPSGGTPATSGASATATSAGVGPSASGSGGSAQGGNAPVSSGGNGGSAGSGGEHARDHCVDGYDPHPSDETMKDGPAEFTKNNQVDLTVQPEVIQWMEDNQWQEAHFQWHNIRRCGGGLGSMVRNGFDPCKYVDMIPDDQECKTDGDGFQFLKKHRHMIQSLKQLWPKHTEQFNAFPKFPQSAEDVPEQWRASWTTFSQTALNNAKILEEVEKPENLMKFESEGALGRWIQCFAPTYSGLHGDLHFHWVRTQNSDHGLGNQFRNIDNYLFWKMHGWIDLVWEKYRVAKGLKPDDPELKAAVLAQCREMDKLAALLDPTLAQPDPSMPTVPVESGEFHEKVRPIFVDDKNKCTGCHNTQGPEAGLTLGGDRSSKDIVAALVNKPSIHGGQFKLVVPGQPDQSWLYLKAAGMAAGAGCTASATAMCNPQVMPPASSGAVTVSPEQLQALRTWIMNGAPAPN
jgi:hypothetical protein